MIGHGKGFNLKRSWSNERPGDHPGHGHGNGPTCRLQPARSADHPRASALVELQLRLGDAFLIRKVAWTAAETLPDHSAVARFDCRSPEDIERP